MDARSADDNSDGDLLRRTADGDRAAFEAIVQRHASAVLRLARFMTANPSLAEDVLQQTFLAAFRSAGGFRGQATARTWLLTIARNAVYKATQKQAREQPTEAEPLAKLGADAGWGSVDPESLAVLAERRQTLQRALAQLSDADREVLTLRDIEQLNGADTCEVLGIELRAMKSRLHRARLRLAASLRRSVSNSGSQP